VHFPIAFLTILASVPTIANWREFSRSIEKLVFDVFSRLPQDNLV
jgi:hypothetical protein